MLSEERQAKLAQKEAAAEAARQRIADQKARAEADSRTRALQAETERLQALEAAEQEYQARYEYYQVRLAARVGSPSAIMRASARCVDLGTPCLNIYLYDAK